MNKFASHLKTVVLPVFWCCLLLLPSSAGAEKKVTIDYQIMVQRATQAAIWAMPAVALVDFKKATIRDLGGTINDVVYLTKPFDSKHGFITANDVTAYAWGSISTAKGPVVLVVPPASEKVSYFGSIVNAWQQPLEDIGPAPGADKGKGAKYLLLPPGFDGKIPDGYIVIKSDTTEIGFAFRPRLYKGATDEDAAKYAHTIKIYYLSEADNPPATTYLDATPTSYNSLPVYDYTFFQDIDDVIQNNPVRPQDKAMVGLLEVLGIKKGKPFKPNDEQKRAMNEGLKGAYAYMYSLFTTPGKAMFPLWKGKSEWQVWKFSEGQAEAGFPYETDDELLIDERAGIYYFVTYLPKYLGGGTFYLTGIRDGDGGLFNGKDTYKLNVPKHVPAKDFWSVIVYSMATKGFVQKAERVGLSSRNTDTMKKNDDGSYDIYFGPKAPKGHETNWIPTGEDFFLLFRLYGPESKEFFKTWSLGDVEKVNKSAPTASAAPGNEDAVVIKARLTRDGRIALYGIFFDLNEAEVKPDSAGTIGEIAKFLKQNPKLNIAVVGHTDNTGPHNVNLKLSKLRADAVVKVLIGKHKIKKDRLFAAGAGFLVPVAPNDTDQGRALNRRVELVRMK